MSYTIPLSERWSRCINRIQARRAALTRPATAIVYQPEPRSIGSYARGQQLCAGNFVFAGHLVQEPDTNIWDLTPPDPGFREEIQGFSWLDDLAAVGGANARQKAQDWLWRWIDMYGGGRGPGWTPDLTGRRLIRWISHALFLLNGHSIETPEAFYRSLAQQATFLGRRWQSSRAGLPRFEALTGLLYAGLSLEGMEGLTEPAIKALDKECRARIDAQGGIPSRNPEELLEIFTLLTWAALTLSESGRSASDAHWAAVERIAPTLRTLRHADGGLARFHGGGRGLAGRLDTALATSGIKLRQPDGLSMGFARLSAGRTSMIIDASAPPQGATSVGAHASTLAFELTSGRRPLIVNCGSGESFGQEWRKAGRATPSHSTLIMSSQSSARLSTQPGRHNWLVNAPKHVPIEMKHASDGLRFEGGHDGYLNRYGITHVRQLDMTFDGRGIAGEDLLLAISKKDQRRFDTAMDANRLQGIPFKIRFHLHPDVDASLDMGGNAISMALKSGELWILRTDGHTHLSLEPSVYLEKNRLKPRATKQIVLSGRAMYYSTRVRWSLAKPQETPISIRDLAQDDMANPVV